MADSAISSHIVAPSSHSVKNILLLNFVWAALDIYAAGTAGYVILHALTGTSWWPIGLLANFAHWLLLPLIGLLPLTLWRKRWPTAALSVAGLLGLLLSYGGLFLPQTVSPRAAAGDDDALPLTVLAYNIQNYQVPADRLLAIIDETDADIVGITELGSDQSQALEDAVAYPYRLLYGDGIPGLGLLSRYPILEHGRFYLETQRLPHLRAVLDIDGVPLRVIVAHPPPPDVVDYSYRPHPGAGGEIAALSAMAVEGNPAVLLGDLNTSDQSNDYRWLLAAGLVDSFRAAGWGFGVTWPANRSPVPPLVRIDYIFHTPEIQTVNAWVGPAGGSDHLPVIAELLLPRAASAAVSQR